MSQDTVTTPTTSPSETSVPVYIFAGFLGAGKTTLLNHLLEAEHGTKLGVIVNDFGSIPVDAMLVAQRAEGIISMPNGCLCCEISEGDFDQALAQLSAVPGVEALVIEASGVAEPVALISMLVRAQHHVPVHFAGLVEVVDASEILNIATSHTTVLQRLNDADLIVLNKTDLVEADYLHTMQHKLAEIAPAIPVITTVKGQVDPRVLFGESHQKATNFTELQQKAQTDSQQHQPHEHDHHHEHLHDSYNTVSVPLTEPLHPGRFMNFIQRGTAGAYRVKGFVVLAGPTECENFIFEKAGRHLSLRRWFPQQEPDTENISGLVFIGTELNDALICEEMEKCLRRTDGTDPVRPGELWSFYPYLDDAADDPNDYYQDEVEIGFGDDYLVDPDEDPSMLP
ncbi:MAG TPA: GTP-binding protein [Corynebacteriales bacterium]|nr:GTP-binding protein [Mycobacteriales bacterium]